VHYKRFLRICHGDLSSFLDDNDDDDDENAERQARRYCNLQVWSNRCEYLGKSNADSTTIVRLTQIRSELFAAVLIIVAALQHVAESISIIY